jgi:predicted nucleic acid-binding protein
MELSKNKSFALDVNTWIEFSSQSLDKNIGIIKLFDFFKKYKIKPYITDKALYEFFAVITNLKRLKKLDIDPKKSFDYLIDSQSIIVLSQSDYTHYIVRDLIHKKEVSGRYIHDIVTIAVLLENQIDCIVTQNKKDFEGILGLEVISLDDLK